MGVTLYCGYQIADIKIYRVPVIVGHADVSALLGRKGSIAEHELLNGVLHIIRQLCAIRSKELDAVILIGIMGGGDHNTGCSLAHHGRQRHCGGGDHTKGVDIGAAGQQSGSHSSFQHI